MSANLLERVARIASDLATAAEGDLRRAEAIRVMHGEGDDLADYLAFNANGLRGAPRLLREFVAEQAKIDALADDHALLLAAVAALVATVTASGVLVSHGSRIVGNLVAASTPELREALRRAIGLSEGGR